MCFKFRGTRLFFGLSPPCFGPMSRSHSTAMSLSAAADFSSPEVITLMLMPHAPFMGRWFRGRFVVLSNELIHHPETTSMRSMWEKTKLHIVRSDWRNYNSPNWPRSGSKPLGCHLVSQKFLTTTQTPWFLNLKATVLVNTKPSYCTWPGIPTWPERPNLAGVFVVI